MKVSFILVMGLLSLLFSPPSAFPQEKVRAVGMATIHRGIVDIARDKAIDQALRAAVEEQVGMMITSFTEVENFQVKLDQILTESKGFVTSYRIISERRQGDNYQVTIEANVGTGRLRDRMKAVDLVMARKLKPRLMLIFPDSSPHNAQAEATMTRYLLSQGFRVIDAARRKPAASPPSGTDQALFLAQSAGAEILLIIKVDLVRKTFRMGEVEISASEVTVSGRVMNGDTGEIISSNSKTRRGEARIVTEEAARELVRSLKEETLDRWAGELVNVTTIQLQIAGLDTYRDLLHFMDQLASEVKGFRGLHQRSYRGGKMELDLEIKGNARGLADDLAAMTFRQRQVTILDVLPHSLSIQLSAR